MLINTIHIVNRKSRDGRVVGIQQLPTCTLRSKLMSVTAKSLQILKSLSLAD